MSLLWLGQLMIDTATTSEPSGLDAAAYLGYRLVTEGHTVLQASIGSALLESALDRAHALGIDTAGWSMPRDGEVIRVLAAEVLVVDELELAAELDQIPLLAALAPAHPREPDAVAVAGLDVAVRGTDRVMLAHHIGRFADGLDHSRRMARGEWKE